MAGLVTLLTDFGTRDPYVGIMKAVMLSVSLDIRIVDVTHEVRPRDILHGAYLFKTAYRWFPKGAVHVAVVDPGVGTERRAVAFRAGGWTFVGPDNGVFSYVVRAETVEEAVEINNPDVMLRGIGDTFQGRDIFAPAAVLLAVGVPLAELGPPVDSLAAAADLEPREKDGALQAKIVHIDRFGNCITNVEHRHAALWSGVQVDVAGRKITGPARTYQDVPSGESLVLFGSSGHLEVAINCGNAAVEFGLDNGDILVVRSAP